MSLEDLCTSLTKGYCSLVWASLISWFVGSYRIECAQAIHTELNVPRIQISTRKQLCNETGTNPILCNYRVKCFQLDRFHFSSHSSLSLRFLIQNTWIVKHMDCFEISPAVPWLSHLFRYRDTLMCSSGIVRPIIIHLMHQYKYSRMSDTVCSC